MKILFILLLFVMTNSLFAQVVHKIKYDGLVHISQPVALRMLDFEVGDNVDEKLLDTSIKTYFAQGYFDDIWAKIDANGVLTFHFKEKPIISKIEVKGYKEDDEDALNALLQIKKGSLYDEQKLEAAKQRIIDAISQDGKIDSVVEIEKEKMDNGSMKITFVVNEGEEITIKKLDFSGLKGLTYDEIEDVIANKQREWMGWLWGRNDGELSLPDLAYDHLRIRELYLENGYLDAQVNPPFVRVDFNHYLADMSYELHEGKQYKISSISVVQAKNVIDNKKLKEVIHLKKGDIFNIKTFREDANRIKTIIADLSYAYVRVFPNLQKNQKDGTVDVTFQVYPGSKVKIRNVIISGNTRTLDRIIRRELYLGPNDMYSLTDLKDSKNALGRLGFFSQHTIEEKRINDHEMDLIVKVKEAQTGNIQIGGGYGSYGGIMVNLAVSDRDIWGSGIDVGIKAEKSKKTSSYSFSISNRHLNDSDFSGDFSIYDSNYDYNYYSVITKGGSVGLGHRITRHLNGYLSYSYTKNYYSYSDDINLSDIDTFYFENYIKSSIIASLKFDNTDDYYVPREGMYIKETIEKAGIGGDAKFIKSRTKFTKYNGLKDYLGFDLIARYKARLYLLQDEGYTPIGEKFYLGGIGSLRGYESYSVSPVIIDNDGITRRIGGKKAFSNSFELSFPLVKKAKMRLVTYLDWGFIGDNSLSEYSRGGYGAGIEWVSPVGPIQLMFSNPLNKKEGDRVSHFDFSMGQRF